MLVSATSITAIICLLSLAVISVNRNRSRTGVLLCIALSLTALLEFLDLLSSVAVNSLLWKQAGLFVESLIPLFWLLCSLTFSRQPGPWRPGWRQRFELFAASLLILMPVIFSYDALIYSPDFPNEHILFLNPAGFWFYIGIMASLIFTLINFEATLTNASPGAFYKVKLEVISLIAITATLTLYYSQALIFRTINMSYLPLRSLVCIVAASIMFYSIVRHIGGVRIEVSRQVAYKSVVLALVGAYLVFIGLVGQGMQYFGGGFPRLAALGTIVLAGIGLLVVLISSRVRQKINTTLHKNFLQNKYDYRNQWLQFTSQIADAPSRDELLKCILRSYCETFNVCGAAVFLTDELLNDYTLAYSYELAVGITHLTQDDPLIRFMNKRSWVINAQDSDPDLSDESCNFLRQHNISFVIPLVDGGGIEGIIMLGEVINKQESYIYEDYDLMKTIAKQASLAILHYKLSEKLVQTREIEAIGKLSTFVVHDLKNLVSNLSLIVQNSSRHIHNPEFQSDMLKSLGNTVNKMQKLIGKLKNLNEQKLDIRPANLLQIAHNTAAMFSSHPVAVQGSQEIAQVDEAEIQNVIMNLLINGIEASPPGAPIDIVVGNVPKGPFISIIDHGCGMAADYIRNDLFKPFRSTKGQGLGIGLYQCRQIVRSHGGSIEVSSTPGVGSTFTIQLPVMLT